MKKALLLALFGILLWTLQPGDAWSALVVDSAAVAPAAAPVGIATSVTVTAVITDSSVLADGVNLQRLDSAGRVVSIIGLLRDDGANGDAVAGDKTFSLRSTVYETTPGPITLRVSAAFRGSIVRAFSSPLTLNITGSTSTGINILAPADLAYLNTSPVVVSGTVGDPGAVVTINGVPAAAGGGSFQASVPLIEGTNTLTAVARNTGGTTSTTSLQVTLDTTPPHLTIESPAENLVTTDSSVSVAGTVNDIVVGTVNNQQASVTVNGVTAQVANRSFLATGVSLALGPNTIQALGSDRAGNSVTTTVHVTRAAPTAPFIKFVSGNNQSATVSAVLSSPLVVALDNGSGLPVANTPVVFRVTDNNGIVTGGGTAASSVAVNTDAQGRAQVSLRLGSRAGAGSNRVDAAAPGFAGTAAFVATGVPAGAALITVDSGNNQIGALKEKLAFPFVTVVTDAGFNRLAGVPVTFTVKQGGGTIGGKTALTMNTDPDGRAAAVLTLGTEPGFDNNSVEATFTGNPGLPAVFVSSAKAPGRAEDTTISGVVLDNSNKPIQDVTVRLFRTNQGNNNNTPVQIGTPVKTNEQGQFLIQSAPVGFFKLMADGTTVLPSRGVFPTLEYDIVTVAGQENTVGMPLLLPLLDVVNKLCVTETTGGTLTLPEVPGFSLTVAPGSATFPGGARSGCVTVSTVNADKSPMSPGFGQQPRFLITIQPVGTTFNPPAPITMPNVDGLQPGQVTELYSYDHDLSAFTAIGTGTVSEDGLLVRSDPGVGILKAGWHCGGNPNSTGNAAPLSVSLAANPGSAVAGATVDLIAKGSPPLDAVYEGWEIIDDPADPNDDPTVGQLTATPSCPNQSQCIGKLRGAKFGVVTVRVRLRCTTTNASVTSNLVKVTFTLVMTLSEVSFLSDHVVTRDRHATFEPVTDPVWKVGNTADQNGEVAYTRNRKIRVAAKFDINPPLAAPISGVTVEADVPGVGIVRATNQTLSGNSYTFPATDSDNNLPNETKLFAPLALNWRYARDGSTAFSTTGTSQNKVYATLADPMPFANVGSGFPVTLLQLAIQNQGATDNTSALQKTWSSFSGPANITTWDGRKMFYYKAGVGFGSCATDFVKLIQTDPESGQCGSFAQLLLGALAINGVQAQWVTIQSGDGDKLIVKNFQFTTTSFPAQPVFKWKLEINDGDYMVPILPGDQFGDLKNVDGLAGQNSVRPSEKLFDRHFIVKALSGYYDPSYGVTYTDERGFETSALEGYATDVGDGFRVDGGRTFAILRARKVSTTTNIIFTVVFSN